MEVGAEGAAVMTLAAVVAMAQGMMASVVAVGVVAMTRAVVVAVVVVGGMAVTETEPGAGTVAETAVGMAAEMAILPEHDKTAVEEAFPNSGKLHQVHSMYFRIENIILILILASLMLAYERLLLNCPFDILLVLQFMRYTLFLSKPQFFRLLDSLCNRNLFIKV